MKVYCIYDSVAKEGSSLFCSKNDATAVRNYYYFIKNNHVENVSDYQLICLGDYDADQPVLEGLLVPEFIDTKVGVDE